jgi:hypothetical protein
MLTKPPLMLGGINVSAIPVRYIGDISMITTNSKLFESFPKRTGAKATSFAKKTSLGCACRDHPEQLSSPTTKICYSTKILSLQISVADTFGVRDFQPGRKTHIRIQGCRQKLSRINSQVSCQFETHYDISGHYEGGCPSRWQAHR